MFTSRKMFPRLHHNHSNNTNNLNNNNARFGSWRTLSRRSYFSRDTTDSESDNERKKFSNNWIYAGIAALYLLIIGIVVTVLVLAPRYPSFYYHPLQQPTVISHGRPIDLEIQGPGQEEVNSVVEIQPQGRPFMPSPSDPIFHDHEMDPRFDLEINETEEGLSNMEMTEKEESRVNLSRINNKFFNLSNIEFTS